MTFKINRKNDALYFREQIKSGNLSPEELIQSSFQLIKEHNPLLNAVVHTRDNTSIQESLGRSWKDKPFGGVPILLKELGQNMAGEPARTGSNLLKNHTSSYTSHFVTQLIKAGFIPIGSTNVPEFGFTNITHSELFGPTRNPYNPDLNAGGSSGGAAAAVASGMVPLAGASDGGGSIRIPASFTGLIGLKPTRGRTPIGPGSGRAWQGAAISFALTKSMRDTAALMDSMQVVQPAAAFQTPLFKEGYLTNLTKPFKTSKKIAYSLKSPIGSPVSQEAEQAVLNAVSWLEKMGFDVVEDEVDIKGTDLMRSYYVMNAAETAAMLGNLEKARGRSISKEEVELLTWVLFQAGKTVSAVDYSNVLSTWDAAAEKAAEFNETYDLFLQPATADTAPRVDKIYWNDDIKNKMRHIDSFSPNEQQQLLWDMWEESLTMTPFTQQANLTGQPAISLPTHLTKNGLPLGIQFTAPKGHEHWLLQIGQMMENDGLFI